MSVECKTCGYVYSKEQQICSWCNTSFVKVKSPSLDDLIVKQEQLEIRHKKELAELKKELLLLKSQLSEQIVKETINVPSSKIAVTPVKKIPAITNEEKVSILDDKTTVPPKVEAPLKQVTQKVKRVQIEERKPSEFERNLKRSLEPLYDGLDLISKVYTKYKTEGKLPIFFMTIGGIAAILFCIGYGMQYTLSAAGVYQGIIKSSLGFLVAIVAIVIGVRLSKRDSSLKEYGSALISLGIIINYVIIYYLSDLGNFPSLSSSLTGFLLIVANTGIAIALALKFEARIIAVLFVVGGAFTPFYLNADGDGRMYYLYLWFLTLGACYVSIKIKWKALQYLAFSISALLVQITVFVEEPSSLIYTVYYHLFGYLFFYFTFFEKAKIKIQLDRVDLVILSANLGLFSYNLFSAGQADLFFLGLTYLFNALLFIVLLLRVKEKLDEVGKLVFLIIIGLFVGLAIPSLLNHALMGLFWAIEAIMLIYLGFLYGNEFIRKEGYLLLGFALAKLGWHSVEILHYWNYGVWNSGLANFSILGLVITLCWALGQRYKEHFNRLEIGLFGFFKEVVPIWLALIFFVLSYGFVGLWSFPLAVVPLFGLIYWSKLFKTVVTVWFGYLNLLVLVFAALISIAETNSIHFLDQRLFAQVAVLELIASLWILKSYFKWLNLEVSALSYGLAKGLRVVFFCLIPLLFIHFSRKIDHSFIGPAIWGSVLITYFLYKNLKHLALKVELFVLVGVAMLFVITLLDLPGMFVGLIVLIGLTVLESSYNKEKFMNSSIKELLVFIPYAVVVLVWFVSFDSFGENFSLSFIISALLMFLLVMLKDKLPIVDVSYVLATRCSVVLIFFSCVAYSFQANGITPLLIILYLILFGVMLYNNGAWYDLKNKVNRWNFAFFLHQLLIVIGLSIIMDWLGIDVEGPISSVLLVLHAIILVFIALKQASKYVNQISMGLFILALIKILTNDIRDFSMPQKVIVFLILGLLLLAASYGYVKLKKKFEVKDNFLVNDEEIIEPKTKIE